MKISDYPAVRSLNEDDCLIVDGETGGTRRAGASDAVLSSLSLMSHHVRRTIFRGKTLGSGLTLEQKTAIQNGTFDGLWLGDYWEIGGVKWRIADFDYWLNKGDAKFLSHHLNIVPDTGLYTAKMNNSDIVVDGYVGSVMRTANMDQAKTTINNAFGDAVLAHREFLINTTGGGHSLNGVWTDSSVDLMSEVMVYGSYICTPSNEGLTEVKRYTSSNTQLALFRACPELITVNGGYWLRDVTSRAGFAQVDEKGAAASINASVVSGVRPVFAIG